MSRTIGKKNIQRAPLSPETQELRNELKKILPLLNADPQWYGSIYYEKKAAKTYQANLKQTQISDQVSSGVVLRIYDGVSLFEQATDDLSPDKIKQSAQSLVRRVQQSAEGKIGIFRRPYQVPSWKLRMQLAKKGGKTLDSEILSQIPKNPTPETPVHFGIRYIEDPMSHGSAQFLEQLKSLIQRCQKISNSSGFRSEDLSYVMARQTVAREEAIFIDSETNMSQALYRLSMMLVTMSGADRTYLREGGLGGLEACKISDDQILGLLKNLKALKNAQRIKPGKYQVLFGPILTGVLAHEAFGHSQEGDTCARGRSKAWDLYRSKTVVGNQHATILNNPAIFKNAEYDHGAWGSYFFDEEGWLAQEQILLQRGKLSAPMTNLTSALRLQVSRTANGKRESWANGVYTRQTNTYFSPGKKTFSQLMKKLKNGYLAEHPAGGMEDPKGMGIQVGISFLQEVKNGKLTGRVFKGPAGGDIQMTGYVPDVLRSIVDKSKIEYQSTKADRVQYPYNDVGGCGKYHKEFVVAGCGGPYLLLKNIILG